MADTTDAGEFVAASPTALSADEATKVIIQSLRGQWEYFLSRIPFVIAGLIVVLLTWGVAMVARRVTNFALRRSRIRPSLRELFEQVTYVTVWIVGMLVAAVVMFEGMTPAKILTAFGLGSIAVGLAFKDIVENFFAGVLILWRFPFENGDYIECNGITGQVERVTIRMSEVRMVDGQLVVLPNALLLKNPVNVMTSQKSRRTTFICGVAYGENVDASRRVIEQAVRNCDTIDAAKGIEIFAQEFADSSINFEVTWWTGSRPVDIRRSRDQVVAAVKHALDQAGIEIPFPYRTLTFKEPLSISNGSEELKSESS